MLTIGSLFSGIGGLELGLERAGLGPVVWQVEMDQWCRSQLERHYPEAERYTDVRLARGKLKKLTDEQVAESVRRYDAGESLQDLASSYNVSRQSMWDLLRRRTKLRPQQRRGSDNHFHRGVVYGDDTAHNAVETALENGTLVRAESCEQCGSSGRMKDGRSKIQAHHDDYNFPLQVRWLCQRCHHEWHKHHTATPRKEVGELAAVDIICGGFP